MWSIFCTHGQEEGGREALRARDSRYSLRRVAARVGVEPSCLSRVERGREPPPSEETIAALAKELEEDPDVLLALAGKVSGELQEIIRRRPALFGRLLRGLKRKPDRTVARAAREVRGGKW